MSARKYTTAQKKATADRQRRRLYGLTPEGYDWMLEQQGDACAMPHCDRNAADVDHDPETGHVRALLCHRCNVYVAAVETAARITQSIHDYVEAHQ